LYLTFSEVFNILIIKKEKKALDINFLINIEEDLLNLAKLLQQSRKLGCLKNVNLQQYHYGS